MFGKIDNAGSLVIEKKGNNWLKARKPNGKEGERQKRLVVIEFKLLRSFNELQQGGNEKMKKLLVLLTLMVGILGFGTAAFSQDKCESCKNGSTVRHIDCADIQESCYDFDYDHYYGMGSGYCPGSNQGNYRAIFNICDCESAATDFKAGQTVGIRMTILVNGAPGEKGAYWSQGATTNVRFGMYDTVPHACAGESQSRYFGDGKFFKYGCVTEVSTLIGDPTCTVPAANQATVILTDLTAGYLITPADEAAKLSHWWIDIQPIRIDPIVLHNGELISVKIELLNQESGGICADCVSVCECTIDVAYVCCTTTSSSSLIFPYYTGYNVSEYWNGIAIVNTGSKAGTATLTAYEQDGSIGTATVSVGAYSMFVSLLENITWTGTGLGDSPSWIKVVADFSADGFAMLANDNHDSMGYLPRK